MSSLHAALRVFTSAFLSAVFKSIFYLLLLHPMISLSLGFYVSLKPFLHPSSFSLCSAKFPSDAFQIHTCS